MTTPTYLGIDVSKRGLDLGQADRYLGHYPNTPSGIEALCEAITPLGRVHVIVESTGGYERALVAACHRCGTTVSVVHPGRVRLFAGSCGIKHKNDRIDSRLLARFGEKTTPRACQPLPEHISELRALRDRREQLIEDHKRERNRLESCASVAIRGLIEAQVQHLDGLISQLDQTISATIAEHKALSARRDIMEAVTGVGPQTAATLLAYVPELGTVNRQRIAAIVGIAPFAKDSGDHHGVRRIGGGRAAPRRVLYMAAVSAARSNTELKAFYQRLREAGKPAKVAYIAVARKLLVHLNARIQEAFPPPDDGGPAEGGEALEADLGGATSDLDQAA